jgi:hypothetical protein
MATLRDGVMARRWRWTSLPIAAGAALAASAAGAQDTPVDLELILAVDVSQSVDGYEAGLQRNGYIQALIDPEVIAVITSAPYGRTAMIYVEWAGPTQWRKVADWQVIEDAESARAFAIQLSRVPIARGQGTSISAAIRNVMGLFDGNGAEGIRRVIDISGDGPNSSGGLVPEARDEAVAAGITVNGVAINNFDGSNFSLPDLDVYYEECVVGGPGAFVVAADGFESFAEAIRRKLILEIASRTPDRLFAGLLPVQASQKYAPACDIGERMRLNDN